MLLHDVGMLRLTRRLHASRRDDRWLCQALLGCGKGAGNVNPIIFMEPLVPATRAYGQTYGLGVDHTTGNLEARDVEYLGWGALGMEDESNHIHFLALVERRVRLEVEGRHPVGDGELAGVSAEQRERICGS